MKLPDEKYERLRRFIYKRGKDGVVVALSGGVDSSTLTAVCRDVLGEKAIAVTAVSPIYPSEDIEEAKKVAKEVGIKHILIKTRELLNENFVRNPENRCYYCKKEMLSRLQNVTEQLRFKEVFEGTNLSDLESHRPGFKAIEEMENVYSPWVENRFTKEEIRAIAKKLELSIRDKPPLACLASRIPYGERITTKRLSRIERAEQIIKKTIGIRQLRVRDHNGLARIEVGRDERKLFFDTKIMDRIAKELKSLGFKYVTMDLEGYKVGSMLLTLENS